jgi:hypothetical protein
MSAGEFEVLTGARNLLGSQTTRTVEIVHRRGIAIYASRPNRRHDEANWKVEAYAPFRQGSRLVLKGIRRHQMNVHTGT